MALETATYISDLNSSNPPGADNVSQADDHLRLIKSTVKATFPSITGAVNATQTELNLLSSTLIARSVIGNGTNAAAVPTAIQAGTDGHVLRRSGTTVAFGQIAAGAIPAAVVTDAMRADRAAVSIWGRTANSIGVGADIVAASNDHVLRRNTNAISFGTVDTGGLTAKAVTYAKIQDVTATSRLLGRVTAGAGVTEELTLTQILDFIGSAAQGDILYRGAASWARLGAGTAGQVLQTGGAGANPSWVTASTTIPYAQYNDEKSVGTDGGTFTLGAMRTRTLNTEHADADGIGTLAANQITLSAGTYLCDITCPAFEVSNHQARLRNITAGTTLVTGTSEYGDTSGDGIHSSLIIGRFTVAAAQVLEVQHQCLVTKATVGFGAAAGLGTEIYTVARFWKVG